MAALVETSDEDATLAVARFTAEMAWANAGPEVAEPQVIHCIEEAQSYMLERRWSDLVSLLLTSADLIFANSAEKDLECIFTVICNLVTKAGSPDEALAMAEQIVTKVTQQPSDKPALRLRILFNLYNMLENPYSKFLVYERALKLAANGKVADLIIPSFKKMDAFLKEWNIRIFQDDGGGMDPECIRRCMSLGYSMKNTNTTIGQYGNGFKTSTMRLGADAIVFTRSTCGSSSTQSIGLLSYTFLRKTGQDDIIVPMVDFELPSDRGGPRMLVRSTESTWKKNLATILQWSPYATEIELMKQFEDIGPHGTKVIVYNLWLNDDGILELDFDTDKEDIRLRGGLKPGRNSNELLQSHISYSHLYSLRAYASILYLRRLPNFQIILRGKQVEYHSLADDLKFSKVVIYKPQLGVGMKEVSVATTIGFTKEAPLINVHGFNIYHKNRLIMPFWKVWQDNSSRGRGVVGVLEANFIEPAHDKQDFEKTAVLLRLESRLKQMTLDFWKDNCNKIGYQGKSKSRKEDPQSDLPSIQNPRPLSSVVPGLPSVVPGVSPQQISNSQGMPPFTNPVGNVQAVISGKELQSVPGTSNKLVNNICEENIQLFMRCEQYRHRQLELNQMITKLETELKDGKRKFAQLVSNVEAQKKQRLDMLRKVHG